MHGAPHGPRLHEGPVPPQRALHVLRREVRDARPQGELGRGEHLRLDPAHVPHDVDEIRPRSAAIEVMAAEAKRVDLPPRNGDLRVHRAAEEGNEVKKGMVAPAKVAGPPSMRGLVASPSAERYR